MLLVAGGCLSLPSSLLYLLLVQPRAPFSIQVQYIFFTPRFLSGTQNRKLKKIFPTKELRGLSDLYIRRIGPHIFLQENRQTDRGNI
jgi:hypothetical protein